MVIRHQKISLAGHYTTLRTQWAAHGMLIMALITVLSCLAPGAVQAAEPKALESQKALAPPPAEAIPMAEVTTKALQASGRSSKRPRKGSDGFCENLGGEKIQEDIYEEAFQ